MNQIKNYAGIDRFRMVAALLIVAIHTSPLSTLSSDADFILTHIIARIAVPFFLMITGYFILPQYFSHENINTKSLFRFVKKSCLIYAAATIIYLPISIYSGQYSNENLVAGILKKIIFDGTFYHLWYLPASIIGIVLVCTLAYKFSLKLATIVAALLYLVGLLGDSYYGITAQIPWLSAVYDAGFGIASFTRNGLLYAPIFLVIGVWAIKPAKYSRKWNAVGFIFSMLVMLAEGLVLHQFDFQRHDSMYISLIPAVYFLFRLLLDNHRRAAKHLRSLSMLVYILHPLFIVVLRVIAKATKLTNILVENSLIQYIMVCALTVTFSWLLIHIYAKNKSTYFPIGRAWIELDMENLRYNVDVLRSLLPNTCQLMPAVKANAYGHGDIQICTKLNALGIHAFCVATVLEGVNLRKNGIKGDILILGYTHPAQFHLLRRYRLMQTVIDSQYSKTLNDYGKKIVVHIKIDTGMHRLGEDYTHISELVSIFNCKNLIVDGAFTHLCMSATQLSETFTQLQIERFYETINEVENQGFHCNKLHIQSSNSVVHNPELSCDYARVGLALYGVSSSKEQAIIDHVSLAPVLSLKTRVEMVRLLKVGESVGYGLQFTATNDMKIAILSIGYADGIPRCLSCGVGCVLIHGEIATIIGAICMDQMIVDISKIADVNSGDIAVVIGESGENEINVCELAQQANTISNEILSRLSNRLERVVVEIK